MLDLALPSSSRRRVKAPPVELFNGESEAMRLEDWLPALERKAKGKPPFWRPVAAGNSDTPEAGTGSSESRGPDLQCSRGPSESALV